MVEAMRKTPITWRIGALLFTSVEQLSHLAKRSECSDVKVVIVLDSKGMIHKARNFVRSDGRTHDRPSYVVQFISNIAENGLDPLLILMTRQRAISLPTEQMARTYNREAWYFGDGVSLVTRN